jgi:hypothetical protein
MAETLSSGGLVLGLSLARHAERGQRQRSFFGPARGARSHQPPHVHRDAQHGRQRQRGQRRRQRQHDPLVFEHHFQQGHSHFS